MRNYTNTEGTVADRFYVRPKVHKRGVPERPVISGCNLRSEKMSEVIDSFFKPLVTTVPSHINDTRHFFSKLRALVNLPRGCILATIDVVALHPSISMEDGLEALRSFLQDQHLHLNVSNGVVKMSETSFEAEGVRIRSRTLCTGIRHCNRNKDGAIVRWRHLFSIALIFSWFN